MSDVAETKERRGPMVWMAGHSVAANLIMLMCLIGGYLSLRNIKQEVFPEMEVDAVQVNMTKHWATPAHCRCGGVDFATAQCTLSDIEVTLKEGIMVRERDLQT